MTHWIRFKRNNQEGFGILDGDSIAVYQDDMFNNPQPSGDSVALSSVEVQTPVSGGKMLALWNNFHALAAKLELDTPQEPLYFMKADSCYLATGKTIRKPADYDGKVIFEGELGIVIGRTARRVSLAEAADYVFGYTCINDVTAISLLDKDPTFKHWTRAKSFDTFGVIGPVIATDVSPDELAVKSFLNDQERQNYPVSDMVFSPLQQVSMISHDLTLNPGDVICCGTSVGVGSMKPGSKIEISIDGIGTLSNTYEE